VSIVPNRRSFLPASFTAPAAPDSAQAWVRLAAGLVVGTVACVGTWSVVVALPAIEAEFHLPRSGASLPYAAAMLGFGIGGLTMGRVADRFGMAAPIVAGGLCLLAGYLAAAWAPNVTIFALAHGLLIGVGASAGFAPLMADLSHWFVRYRGFAVTVAATGSYMAGALWPRLIQQGIATHGWRPTHAAIGIAAAAVMLPLSLVFLRQPLPHATDSAEQASAAARAGLGLSPGALQALLTLAGFACCTAMSMPQVHLVAYCGDLGYGAARGAEMLSLMLSLGIVSRLASGLVSDRIGAAPTLLIGSCMQAVALFLYLFFDGLASLYVISGVFGLFQGGIVPMYTVIIRDYLPAREAGARVGLVIMATVLGMAFGGYVSGLIFDLTASYRMAFLNGLLWNFVNLLVVAWLAMRPTRRAQPA
jgi:MFS family permease